jgi:hypothetical protein
MNLAHLHLQLMEVCSLCHRLIQAGRKQVAPHHLGSPERLSVLQGFLFTFYSKL